MGTPEITQPEHGQPFTVTRDGHRIAELIPQEEFTAMSGNAPGVDLDAFRADQEAAIEQEATSPYER